jgi:hypothetical protein
VLQIPSVAASFQEIVECEVDAGLSAVHVSFAILPQAGARSTALFCIADISFVHDMHDSDITTQQNLRTVGRSADQATVPFD